MKLKLKNPDTKYESLKAYERQQRGSLSIVTHREYVKLKQDKKEGNAHLLTDLVDTEEPGGEGDLI